MIRLTEIIRTIRLYGQSPHPKRITGIFTIQLADGANHIVEMIEGHVNKSGRPQRLISFVDDSQNGTFSEFLKSHCSLSIEIGTGAELFPFTIERASIEVVGVCDEKTTEHRYRGDAVSRLNPKDRFSLYETDSPDKRRFYMEASQEVLARAMQCIADNGSFELVVCSAGHS